MRWPHNWGYDLLERDCATTRHQLFSPLGQAWYQSSHEFPLIDIHETDEAVQLLVDLPGMQRDDIKISVEDQLLVISGTRETPESPIEQERWRGDFCRRVSLGKKLDPGGIEAKLRDGVLTVSVPKQPEQLPKTIKIE